MSTELMVAVFGLSGIASGFLAGLFGIGGGLIMVPVLVYAFKTTGMDTDHVVTMALGTSMFVIARTGRFVRPIPHHQRLSSSVHSPPINPGLGWRCKANCCSA